MSDRRTAIIWRFTDGKPGHDKQSAGLVKALQDIMACEVLSFPAKTPAACLTDLVFKRSPLPPTAPWPDLVVGAGHATHLSLLAAKRALGCNSVVLMKPSLPVSWFDVCLIPGHDGVPEGSHVIPTEGAINNISIPARHKKDHGLILLGGPSKHFVWDNEGVIRQIKQIAGQTSGLSWHLCTSRRTPESILPRLSALQSDTVTIMPHTDCPPGWLDRELQECRVAWVSADSVSMIYEAITAGAQTGVIEPGRKQADKITRAIDTLIASHMITPFTDWANGQTLHPPEKTLNEAQRCAELLQKRYLSGQPS